MYIRWPKPTEPSPTSQDRNLQVNLVAIFGDQPSTPEQIVGVFDGFTMSTELLTRQTYEIGVPGMGCEDCPRINFDPPSKSDCPDFDASFTPPVCNRGEGLGEQITGFLAGINED